MLEEYSCLTIILIAILTIAGDGIYHSIHARYHLRQPVDERFTDIYSGKLYQKQVSSGILDHKNNISLIMNTDGIPVFRSSKCSFRPIYLLINELPFKMR